MRHLVTRWRAYSASTPASSGTWPPGLHVFPNFGSPAPEKAASVLDGARGLVATVAAAARCAEPGKGKNVHIPQPVRSQKHNLAQERSFVPLILQDPGAPDSGTTSASLKW